jgi:hypothetical protein
MIKVLLRSPQDEPIYMNMSYLETFLAYLLEGPDRLIIEFYGAALCISLPLLLHRPMAFPSWILAALFVSSRILLELIVGKCQLRAMLAAMRSLWMIGLATCLRATGQRRYRRKASLLWWLTLVLTMVVPLTSSVKVTMQLFIFVLYQGAIPPALILWILVMSPNFLKMAFDLRNFAIFAKEFGISTAFSNEVTLTFNFSSISLLAALEMIFQEKLTDSSRWHSSLSLPNPKDILKSSPYAVLLGNIAVLYSLAVSIGTFFIDKLYYLPFMHASVVSVLLLSRIPK